MKMGKITLFLVLISSTLLAQNPLIKQWDKRFGADETDNLTSIAATSDGGFILGGHSFSGANGDKTEPEHGNTADYWVIKTDSVGNKIWDRTLWGNMSERLSVVMQSGDGGYIVGGSSFSDSSGDKSYHSWGNNSYDYWILKLDANGNKLWDHAYGGTNDDELYTIQCTADGGYILGGYSHSDSSGDKSQNSWHTPAGNPSADYWIIKIDSSGNKLWDKIYGGTGGDRMKHIQQTSDGGYILGGFSTSDLSGDKTESSYDSSLLVNYRGDYWIVKTDSLGNKLWDKTYGGEGKDEMVSVYQLANENLILGGYSNSGTGGIKSQPSWGGYDYWMIKTDETGTLLWEKSFGGSGDEYGFNIYGNIQNGSMMVDDDGGIIMAGVSTSGISGDKTEANLGPRQVWLLKADSSGNKLWDKTIFTTGTDDNGYIIPLPGKCYAIANNTRAGSGGYKTQPSWGFNDYWMVTFCDTTSLTSLHDVNNQIHVDFAPNPFNDVVTLYFNYPVNASVDIKIYDLSGKLIFQEKSILNQVSKSIKTVDLAKGMYLFEVVSEGISRSYKILKQ